MKSIVDILAKLRRLSGQERWLLVRAWLLLLLTDVALRLLPFATILRYCAPPDLSHAPPPVHQFPDPSRIVWLVEKAGRYCPAGTSCLKEALVLSRLLALQGIPATLRIGVGRRAEAFAAHAWVELDGRVILGEEHVRSYTPLLSGLP